MTYANEQKFEILHHQKNPYRKVFSKPYSVGQILMDTVEEKMKASCFWFFPDTEDEKKKGSHFWLLPLCFAWIAALLLTLAGGLIFGLFFFLPLWYYLFGIKYLVLMLRKISYTINQLTPFFIIVFLFYSPVCKQIPDAAAPAPAP